MRTWLCAALITNGVLGVSILAQGCGSSDCSFTLTCGQAVDGGGDSAGVYPAGCTGQEPNVEPACVSEQIALFVSSRTGIDGGTGTSVSPFRRVADAIGQFSKQQY